MGKTMSSNPMTDYSIASVRLLGRWGGDIYVLTDCPKCFVDAQQQYNAKIVTVPSADTLMHIKALKAQMFSHLPSFVQGALYIDVDIVVVRSLEDFLYDVAKLVAMRIINKQGSLHQNQRSRGKIGIASGAIEIDGKASNRIEKGGEVDEEEREQLNSLLQLAAFPDAKGHYVGFCSGCEKWHTGVVIIRRGSTKNPPTCLSAWEKIILSGNFDTDQESLDSADRQGHCSTAMELPSKHLLFAKDYIGMALTSGHTFIHLTGAGHMQDQGYLYREIIVPRIYSSLNPPLHLSAKMKECKQKSSVSAKSKSNM